MEWEDELNAWFASCVARVADSDWIHDGLDLDVGTLQLSETEWVPALPAARLPKRHRFHFAPKSSYSISPTRLLTLRHFVNRGEKDY